MKSDAGFSALLHSGKLSIWRVVWYSVSIWLLGFLVSAVVLIPWFYPALAIVVVGATIFYFKVVDPLKVKRGRKPKIDADRIFAFGLAAAITWFFIMGILSVLQIAGFYYFNFVSYFSDFRNWYFYTLIILVPVIYSLVLENMRNNRGRKRGKIIF